MDHADDVLVGGRYRLRSRLGRGGMGTVWAARDELLRRDVAVKEVLLPVELDERQHEDLRERTMREARAAARISSDAALTVYDVVEFEGRPWIVMELLEPRTLADELRERGRLSPTDTAAMGLVLLDALEAAHAAGVLHRDVKPGNVMMRGADSARPRFVLADFGIAHLAGDPTVTSTGMVVGSPAYVAPERARGESATSASDLWSLGATLWACVEGTSPFQREGALPTLAAVVTEDVPAPRHAGALRPALEALLVKDPAARADVATARRLLRQVAAAGEGPHTSAAPVAAAAAPTGAAPSAAADPTSAEPTPAAPTPAAPVPAERTPAGPTPAPRDEPVAAPPPSGTGRRRRGLVLLAAALAVAVGALLLAVQPWTDDEPTPSAGPTQTAPDTAGPEPTQPADEEPAPSEPATQPPGDETEAPAEPDAPAEGEVPDGFVRYEDETGFSLAVPEGWEAERDGPRVRLSDPASSAYLMVDQTDQPAGDPVEDWRRQEQTVSQRLEDYEFLRIEPADYRGWAAADWEFLHGSGQSVRVLNRNVVTAEDQAYALYWSVPSGEWDERWPTFEVAAATFSPRA